MWWFSNVLLFYFVLCKKCSLVCVTILNNDIERNFFAIVRYENVTAGQF